WPSAGARTGAASAPATRMAESRPFIDVVQYYETPLRCVMLFSGRPSFRTQLRVYFLINIIPYMVDRGLNPGRWCLVNSRPWCVEMPVGPLGLHFKGALRAASR